ncbi:cyclic nucleotide-binding domain-containing protein [Noviherbaspirillum sp.]|uniref:Crp/Fnr family transcriptional regulator n=1 Tax=Noviherbaspirillum sp. TaxID=1926288 RepID=UPI002B4752E6|nr:cyclic nucleotide-binding domain-containing protein [Noviherbaspirillum sp.]HJV82218.1 cyclic nucleotide-binding domain-containing protein [Noviherbaspirillum sp.]
MSVHCAPETYQLLLKLDLFRGLEQAELARLLEQAELVECRAGEYPIREGEQDRHLFVLLSGKAGIYKRSFGVQKLLQELGPGECFGEMSLIECRSRSASVKAINHCRVLRLDGDDIAALPDISSKLFRNIAVLLSQRLRHANEIMTLG